MRPIAIFYHCLYYTGMPPEFSIRAFEVVSEQMHILKKSGLLENCNEFHVGINGGDESRPFAAISIPPGARFMMHGLQSKSENLTVLNLGNWAMSHPGWNVLYFHSKGATHTDPIYKKHGDYWRNCMMRHCVWNWARCVKDLSVGFDSVGCHWLTGMGSDHSQNYWGGNFWWATSDFLRTIPSMYRRDRIRMSGIDSLESRFESEVWIGNGPRLPKVRDYHSANPSIRNACLNQTLS